ncbi:MAG: LLM class flavin-dependent oxidoreductase [Thaumarchaeota archaeon]|nr:LLM class flavin-dependent oxidoreductase [Nitrososphaerota archaeon]
MSPIKISVDLGENFNDPQRFVGCATIADKFPFDTVWFGDHFLPWFHGGNQSSYVWSVMPVALEISKKVRIGPDVTSPIGGRYHPAIIAQAAATLDNMYPGRFVLGVGSGEAVNEARFFPGDRFPKWRERTERLCEGITVIRKLWESKEYFSFEGTYFKLKDVFLYTKPRSKIPIYFSAIGKKATAYAGQYGDHLTTINTPEKCKQEIFPIFEAAARKAGKDSEAMEKLVLIDIFFGDKDDGVREIKKSGEAGSSAEGAFGEMDPRRLEEMGKTLEDEKISASKYFVSSPDQLIGIIESYQKAGATHVDLVANSFPERINFIGEKVLPYFVQKDS